MSTLARNGLLLLAIGGLITGCGLITVFGSGDDERGFNHAAHNEDSDAGLECSDCHGTVEDEDNPGMPVLAGCAMCHGEEPDEDEPLAIGEIEQRFFVDGALQTQRYSALDDEVIFSHLKHVEAGIECSACHGDVDQSTSLDASVAMTMADCESCHEQQQAPNECSTCHERLDVDVMPDNHMQLWMKTHGDAYRAPEPTTAQDCSMCHEESSCRSCHQTTPPENHNNFFRRRGHGLFANMDRASCATCHRSDTCDACHQDTQPLSHTGSFGGTLNTHCIGCHVPIENSGCATCHRGGGRHATATPLPPGHSAAWDCRLCHGATLPNAHIDNGDDCTYCHR